MGFGQDVLEELRKRGLRSHFRYEDIQVLRGVSTASEMRALLARKGHHAGEERIDPLHFTDLIEIEILKQKLKFAGAAVVLFALT